MHLLYIADPLCSWCYGFGPELGRLLARNPGTRLDLVMGGLRAGNREPASAALKAMLREHWTHVARESGLPFNDAALDRPGFVYDTEPACRAVVTGIALDPTRAYALFGAIQAAFYRDARDVTREDVLADIAEDGGYGRAAFLARHACEDMRESAREDFATAQDLGVNGFPTLAVSHEGELFLVASGYTATEALEQRLAQIDAKRGGGAVGP